VKSNPTQRALYREVGSKIREGRERLGLTQEALAKQVGLSRTSITNIEQGRQTILVHQLVAFAQLLNLEPNALLPPSKIEPAGEVPPEIAHLIPRLKPNHSRTRK
jgi:transcriptional regulator with XRE-family HTH domain